MTAPRKFIHLSTALLLFVLKLAAEGDTDTANSLGPASDQRLKPRVLVLTDISNEPDDEESLVRLLVYSNEFEIEGLIATTSVWLKDKVRPELIKRTIEAYAQVQGSLAAHAAGYPSADHLLSLVKAGLPLFGMAGGGRWEGERRLSCDYRQCGQA